MIAELLPTVATARVLPRQGRHGYEHESNDGDNADNDGGVRCTVRVDIRSLYDGEQRDHIVL